MLQSRGKAVACEAHVTSVDRARQLVPGPAHLPGRPVRCPASCRRPRCCRLPRSLGEGCRRTLAAELGLLFPLRPCEHGGPLSPGAAGPRSCMRCVGWGGRRPLALGLDAPEPHVCGVRGVGSRPGQWLGLLPPQPPWFLLPSRRGGLLELGAFLFGFKRAAKGSLGGSAVWRHL